MVTTQVQVERFSVISSRSFHEVVAQLEKAIGHPDMNTFEKNSGQQKRTMSWKRSSETQRAHRN
jgi:hypothetical protein